MDCAELSWLSEMGLDNSFFTDQLCDFTDNDILGHDLDSGKNNSGSSSSTLINSTPSTNSITSLETNPVVPPHKLQKPNNFSTFSTRSLPEDMINNPNSSSAGPIILDFGKGVDRPHPPLNSDEEAAVSKHVLRSSQPKTTKKPGGRVRPPSQTYDHIIAERKRRELLSQRFVALSTIVPGLKKMDKTSVLGDAIKYLKHLQERVKTLEKQATQQTMESVVLVRKSHVLMDDDNVEEEVSSEYCSEDKDHQMQTLPEIEARVCNSHILVRVHCKRQHGVLVNLLGEVEKLNLVVTNTNVSPFGSFALDITIVCEIEKEFELTVKQVVKTLRAALK